MILTSAPRRAPSRVAIHYDGRQGSQPPLLTAICIHHVDLEVTQYPPVKGDALSVRRPGRVPILSGIKR